MNEIKDELTNWIKPKRVAAYAGVSERTFRDLLKAGLRHVRLPSGTILTKPAWIDEYYHSFEVTHDTDDVNAVAKLVDEVVNGLTDKI